MNFSDALHPAAGRDHAADDRHRARRLRRVLPAAGLAAAAGRFPDHLGAGARCRAPAPRRWRPRVATPLERHLGQIADVTEMTSSSSVGSTRITLQFGLDRDIDGAARDVQAAINAARADLPTSLRSNPTYHKVNPADAPIMILALTSTTLTPRPALRRRLDTCLQQKLSQIDGRRPGRRSAAARCRRCGSSSTRARSSNTASGSRTCAPRSPRPTPTARRARSRTATSTIRSTPTTRRATPATTSRWSIAYRNGAAVRLTDVAEVVDSVENLRNAGPRQRQARGAASSSIRQPGANIIDTVDRVKAMLPQLEASIPSDIDVAVADRPHDDDPRLAARCRAHADHRDRAGHPGRVRCSCATRAPTLIPSVAVPVSLIGTFGVMYLLGFSLDNLSLMALTISTGFVVDDAIVVLENITRHIEAGMPRMRGGAARRARGRLHRAVDEPLADRGVRADPADGRHRRAAVPRVRDDAVGRDR